MEKSGKAAEPGLERSLSPFGQNRGRWVPCPPPGVELRPGSQNSKAAKRRSKEARQERNDV